MYYIIEGKPINLPFQMSSQIKEAMKKTRACLPYRMVSTLIFQELNIDYIGEDAKRLFTLIDTTSDPSTTWATIRQMTAGSIELPIRELLLVTIQMRKMMMRRRMRKRRSHSHLLLHHLLILFRLQIIHCIDINIACYLEDTTTSSIYIYWTHIQSFY